MPPVIKLVLLTLVVGILWGFHIYLGSAPEAMLEVNPAQSASGGPGSAQDVGASGILNRESKAHYTSGVSVRKLDINKATTQDFETLPGVGRKLAAAIIRFRDNHGNFKALEQLKEVRGIGEKKFAGISRFLTLEGRAEETPLQVSPREE
ncbi:MAG: ComEA family DNA-binding protein [Nitrospiria bacterium]